MAAGKQFPVVPTARDCSAALSQRVGVTALWFSGGVYGMPQRKVLVHSCFDGKAFGVIKVHAAGKMTEAVFADFSGPADCSCSRKISFALRDAYLHAYEVYVVRRPNVDGLMVPNLMEVVWRRARRPKFHVRKS